MVQWRPDYVVVASRTSDHGNHLKALATAGFTGRVLVEKPLFDIPSRLPEDRRYALHVGYTLRFHPVLQALRQELEGTSIFSVHAYVGQYLPDWRPGTDYRNSYSAHADQGGGALRDLSHELDYLNWLLGGWRGLVARGGRVSDLEIDSDDVYALILETVRCPIATATMNYLDRTPTRTIIVHTNRGTLRGDLIGQTLNRDGAIKSFKGGADDLYRAQHRAILADDAGALCTINEGLDVMAMIEAAERSTRTGLWISRSTDA